MSEAFESIRQGLQEAITHANGEHGLSVTIEHVPEARDGLGAWRTTFSDDDAGATFSIILFPTLETAMAKARAFVDGVAT